MRQIVYDVQFTEPSEDPDEDVALYDAVTRAQRVILATGEIDDEGGTRVLGGERSLAQAGGARAAASTFPTDPGGAIRRYAREDTHLATIPALVGERFGPKLTDERALIDFRGPPGTIPTYSFVGRRSKAGSAPRSCAGRSWSSAPPRPRCRTSTPHPRPGRSRWPAPRSRPMRSGPRWKATRCRRSRLGGRS